MATRSRCDNREVFSYMYSTHQSKNNIQPMPCYIRLELLAAGAAATACTKKISLVDDLQDLRGDTPSATKIV